MKLILFLGFIILLTVQWVSAHENNSTSLTRLSPSKARFVEIVAKRLQNIWSKFSTEDESFIGRCFGVARKLKFVMPLIIFKLGVIITVLAFLTIFSLKTLGLLGFLVLFNVSGAMTKIALAFSGKYAESKPWSPPQNVHFHVHQTKDGNFDLGHTAPAAGWDDRLGKYGSSSEDLDNLEASNLNLYNKLNSNSLFLRNHGYLNR